MSSRSSLFALFLVAISFALPLVAHAAGVSIPFFGPIIDKSWTVGNGVQCALGWGAVMTVVNNIIRLLISIAIVFVAPLTIAYAGFLYVVNPYDPSGISKAKGILWNTVIGIVIALAGWMIVDAVMVVLYSGSEGSTKWGTWASLITSGNAPTCLPQQGVGTGLNQGINGAGVTVVTPAVKCDILTAYTASLPGIAVSSSGNCCDRNNNKCTSLDGMLRITVQQIKNVNAKCGPITVTGGTETGHSGEGGTAGSHYGGSKVDIGQNIISCIRGATGSKVIDRPTFGLFQVQDRCGNVYTWEGSHTDISVISTCSL